VASFSAVFFSPESSADLAMMTCAKVRMTPTMIAEMMLPVGLPLIAFFSPLKSSSKS
jgi:predicted metal-binding membrane protein